MALSRCSTSQEASCSKYHYKSNALDAINIIFVRKESDLTDRRLKFKPLYTHQIFDNDIIYGYYKPKIDIYVAAHSAQLFVEFSSDDIIRNKDKYGLQPDDIMGALQPWFRNNLGTNLSEFIADVNKPYSDSPFGECFYWLRNENADGVEASFCVINSDVKNPEFKKFHQRFESLSMMFMDTANFIDLDNENWKILYLYEKCNMNGEIAFCPVGLCTIYLLESDVTIARISQFFIVPFLQKLGLGYKLLQTTYMFLSEEIPKLDHITVERPNKIFNRMKNNVDITYLLNDPVFSKENLLQEYSDEMIIRCRIVYKFSNDQSRKLYEILRYYYARHDETQKQACIDYITKNLYLKYIREDETKPGTSKSKYAEAEELISQPIDYIRQKYYNPTAEEKGHYFGKKVEKYLEFIGDYLASRDNSYAHSGEDE